MVWGEPEDARLRREAIAWLTVRSNDGADSLSTDELLDFTFDGEPFRLMDAQPGIRKPAVLPHALSIRTVHTPLLAGIRAEMPPPGRDFYTAGLQMLLDGLLPTGTGDRPAAGGDVDPG
ncbi:MAG: hypothetical protein ACFCVG_19375 [Kineosporiaceae bacterium]